MDSGAWIEALARRARQEPAPELRVLTPSLESLRPRAAARTGPPPGALWLSGAAALAAASLVLAIGLHAQRTTATRTASSTASSTPSSSSMNVLFAPLETSTP